MTKEELELISDPEHLIAEVSKGNGLAEKALCGLFEQGLLWYLRRLGGQKAEAHVGRILTVTIQAVRTKEIQKFQQVAPFARATARRLVGPEPSAENVSRGAQPSADKNSLNRMENAIEGLSAMEREALARYYTGELIETICGDLGVSVDDFLQDKSAVEIPIPSCNAGS